MQLSLFDGALDVAGIPYLPLNAYDRPGTDLDAPLSTAERAALAHHGLIVTPRTDGDYDAGDRVLPAWCLRQEIDLFYLGAKNAQPSRHPLEGL